MNVAYSCPKNFILKITFQYKIIFVFIFAYTNLVSYEAKKTVLRTNFI